MSERKGRKYAAMALALILLFQGCLSDGLPVCALEHAEGADAGEEKTADSGCAEDTGAVSCVPEEPGETSEETEKETETEPEETPEPTEKIFPGWTLKSAVNDAGNTVRNEAGTYYFRGCLEVLFQIEPESEEESTAGPVFIQRDGTKLPLHEGYFTDILYDSGVYVYTMEAEDGSKNPVTVTVAAGKVNEGPGLQIRYTPEPAEIRGRRYVQEVPEICLRAEAPAGVARVEYDTEGGPESVLEVLSGEGEILYGEHTECEILLNGAEAFPELSADMEDGVYRWKFRVTDVLGGTAEEEAAFIVDRTAPDGKAFVSYHSDGTGGGDPPHTGIMELARAFRDKLFGRSRIGFDLYVRDGILPGREEASSGIDVEDLLGQITAAEGKTIVQEVQRAEEGLASFSCDGVWQEGYVHLKGTLVLPADHQDAKERLCIGRLKDLAGNITGGIQAEPVTGTTVLYFDRTPPVLLTDWGAGIADKECGCIFYREDALVRLALDESNYGDFVQQDNRPVAPRVHTEGSGGFEERAAEWTADGYGAHTELSFPASAEAGETKYSFRVEYEDGSGNLLETDHTCMGSTEQGIYTSCPVVIDNRPPVLTDFSISGIYGGRVGGADLYQSVEGNDVVLSFTIDDHAAYWDPDRVFLRIVDRDTGETAAAVQGGMLVWESEGREHRGEYAFDGREDQGIGCYEARVSYEDRAGNLLTGSEAWTEYVTDGVFTGGPFLLDHEAPVFTLSLSEANRLVFEENTDPSHDLTASVPETGYTAYYREAAEVRFSLTERCMEPVYQGTVLRGIRDLCLTVTGEDGRDQKPEVVWRKQGDVCGGSFSLTEEGRYRISISYRDLAGNAMVSGGADGSRQDMPVSEDGIYESVLLVVDRTAPVLRMSCVDRFGKEQRPDRIREEDLCAYFSEPVYLKLEAEDQNLRMHELVKLLEGIRVTNGIKEPIEDNSVTRFLEGMDRAKLTEGSYTLYIPLFTEAVYELPVRCEDLAGNQMSGGEKKIVVDRTCPGLQMSCAVEPSGYMDAFRFGDVKYLFADSRVTVRLEAEDAVSGIERIRCTLQEEDGTIQEKEILYEPADRRTWEFMIPAQAADYRGTVMVEVWDWTGNCISREWRQTVESRKKHRDTGRIWIETDSAPGRTVQGTDYYNTDVRFRLMVEDAWSGLKNLSCTGGTTIDFQEHLAEESGLQERGILYAHSQELLLEAVGNNENEVQVRAEYEDLAGHTGVTEQFYHIDITPPVLEVVYDNEEPSAGGLYNRSRTAVVTIQERNFDPADVEFLITGTDGNMPRTGEWESTGEGDASLHVCRVLFAEDGDYTFSVNVTDLAGNRAEYGRTDAFTIDQTGPVLTVSYEDGAGGDRLYYSRSRTAVVDILERHFDPLLVQVALETSEGVQTPAVSGWTREGDHHRASVVFASDGAYSFGITGTDLAGNELAAYGPDHFIIDQTPPELVIQGVEDHSANNGEVMPRIWCAGENYGAEYMEIQLEGALRGGLDPKGSRMRTRNGEIFQMEDFPREPEADDLYRLTARVRDLAGNESAAEAVFSVNRFGSVYTLEDRTELLAGRRGMYYTRQEQDIIVTETNVDTLEFREITLSLNGKLSVLEEGADYSVQPSGTKESWKQYVYTIPGKNFEKEGTYILTICSEDRAANVSDNHTKGKKIEFVVDKTSPSILLSGVEDGGRYRERSREVTLDIKDNVKTAEVKVEINGVECTYHASEVAREDGRIRLMVGNDRRWQNIRVTAYDAAGNKGQLETGRFLITPDLLVQFFMDKKLFYGSMGGMVVLWAGTWHILFRRKRLQRK